MTAAALRAYAPQLALGIAIAASLGLSIYAISLPFPGEPQEHALCDRAVDALLHSKELVEVTRAGIIIQQVNCGIGKRL
jgi:hypothetical protein